MTMQRLCASSPGIYVPTHHARSPVRSTNTSSDGDGDGSGSVGGGGGLRVLGGGGGGGSSSLVSMTGPVSRLVDVLTDENRVLREELATTTVRVSRLSKFEIEVLKMHEAHEALLQSHQKREALWLAMRRKLEERILILEDAAAAAAGGGGGVGATQPGGADGHKMTSESEWRVKLAEKEALISRLLAQNQELVSSRKQVESENIQLNVTLAEQRAHVAIVEKALVNCQAKVLLRDEQISCEKAAAPKTVTSPTKANDQQDKDGEEDFVGGTGRGCVAVTAGEEAGSSSSSNVAMWKQMVFDKDAHIRQLEEDISCLKQACTKETSPICLDQSSQPLKEVRLAALEKNSSDVEKLIDEAKTEKLKHMEELHESNKKMAELDAKVRQLQTQLVEKEAMVKVFQRSPYSLLPRSSSLHALCHHSTHSPRPSSSSLFTSSSSSSSSANTTTTATAASLLLPGTGSCSGGSGSGGGGGSGGGTHREFSSIRHMKTGSTSAIDLGRKLSIEEDLLTRVQNLNAETKDNESTEEVRLWHV